MTEKESKGATIFSETGESVVSITSIKRDGDRLLMEGKLMGAWDAKMYMPLESAGRMVKLMLSRAVISYVFSLPIILWRRRKGRKL